MKCTFGKVVGYWHYGIILTYMSVISAVIGIAFSAMGMPSVGVICLFVSGTCDAFDGAVAKTRKDRTDDDKRFGTQIDSLSDLVAFGVAPVMIGVGLGLTEWYFIILYAVYVLCALVRLAYYNVTEETVMGEDKKREFYEGLPVTNITYIIPPVYLVATMFISPLMDYPVVTAALMAAAYLITAILFVVRFRCPKWKVVTIAISIVITTAVIIGLFLIRWYVCGIHGL